MLQQQPWNFIDTPCLHFLLTQKESEADCELWVAVVLSVADFACRTDLISGSQYPSPNQQWSTVDLFSKAIEVKRK
jgi:hypothetical protein